MKTHPLNSFAQHWEVDGDLIRCRMCRHGQHVSRAAECFRHAARCSDKQAEERPWLNFHTLLRAQLSSIAPSGEARAPNGDMSGLVAHFTRSLPTGLDDAGYADIETELDRIDAPLRDTTGRWLKVHERIAALGIEIGRAPNESAEQKP